MRNELITIDGKEINYEIRKSKLAKRIRVSVFMGRRIVLTLPVHVRYDLGKDFINNKKYWIGKQMNMVDISDYDSNIFEFSDKHYIENKQKCLDFCKKRVEEINKICNFEYNKIFVRKMKTQWGSCSSNKNLGFNYKIIFLPQKEMDSIIIHELCHLKEMNHSPRFWMAVRQLEKKLFQEHKL